MIKFTTTLVAGAFFTAFTLSGFSQKPTTSRGNNSASQTEKPVKGWYLGISGGASINLVKMDFSDAPYFDVGYYTGAHFPGLEASYRLNKQVFFNTALHFVQKGQQVNIGLNKDFNQINLIRQYLILPIGTQITFFQSAFSPYAEAGFYAGYWVNGFWKVKHFKYVSNIFDEDYGSSISFEPDIIEFKEKYDFRNENNNTGIRDNRFDFGMYLGAGFQYELKNHIHFMAGFRYSEGLVSLDRGNLPRDHEKKYNETFTWFGGMRLPLNLFKK